MGSIYVRAPADLEPTDHALLRELVANAHITNGVQAGRVGITPSARLARVRSLRERGHIRGFHIDVDPAAPGLVIEAMVAITLRADVRRCLTEFVTRVRLMPRVRDVYFLAGEHDFLLYVTATDTTEMRDVVATLTEATIGAGPQTTLISERHRGRHSVL